MKKILNFFCLISFFCCTTGVFAQSTVTGKVTDENGIGILGATVQVRGTNTGSVTDEQGAYSIQANQGDVLVFSYIGFATQRATVSGSTVDVQLQPDVSILNEVVVSSTRKPVRKLQATSAINSVGIEEIAVKQPESFSEAIENTPGITVNASQGRKASFNIRGFPGGNVYTTTLIDGLPVSGFAGASGGTQEFYGLDPAVDRIEVVRGAAATLFGRAAGAGAVNIISKTGGTEHKGSFSFTKYNNVSGEGHQFDGDFDYRVDAGFSGPISDKLRYNVGGYIIEDSGTKEQANKDKGAQIRANFDWLISDESFIRISGTYLNNQFQNITDVPWDLGKNELGGGFSSYNTFYNDARQLNLQALPSTPRGGTAPFDVRDSSGNLAAVNPSEFREEVEGGNFGLEANIALGSGWYLNEKLRYQDFDWADQNEISFGEGFTFSGFYGEDDDTFRLNVGGFNQNKSLISETRIQKQIDGATADHNISAGVYFSDAKRDRLSLTYSYFSDVSVRPTFTGFFGAPLSSNYSVSGTSAHREENVTGLFIGDEMVFNDKLSINVAFRYDILKANVNNDPEEIRATGFDYTPATFSEEEIKAEDYSLSAGFNYVLGESSAIYANYVRAFSLPLFSTVAAAAPEENEIINNLELGYRAGLGDLTLDGALFYSKINNRVATIFDAAVQGFVQAPDGSNKILGGELALTYAPKAVKGLLLRGSVTVQNSEYVDFIIPFSAADPDGELFGLTVTGDGTNRAIDIGGNQVQGTPKTIFNLNLGYTGKNWGANFGGFTYTGIYADAFNLYDQPNLSIYNLGFYKSFALGEDQLKLSLLVKNLFDGANPQLLLLSSGNDDGLAERQNNTDQTGRLAFSVVQPPKRVLFTVGYSF